MGKFLKISEAARLTGQTEAQLRRLVLTVLNHGNRLDKGLIKQREDEDWEIDSTLLEDATNGASKSREQRDEILELISDQLKAKDQQIANMQEQINQMIERNRETNVMLHKLQQQLAINSGNSPTSNFQSKAENIETENETKKDKSGPTSFAEWAKRYR